MRHEKIILSLISVAIVNITGWSQNLLWTLPSNYVVNTGIGFSPPIPLPLGNPSDPDDYHGQAAEGSSNAAFDVEGNMLFFVVDGKVYNKRGQFAGELTVGGQGIIGGSETVIVPAPGNCFRYYLFTTSIEL